MGALSHAIFSNIPKEDYLSLFEKGEARVSKVIKLVGFKKEDIAKATDVPSTSIRYDGRMPKILKDRMREWANLLNLVAQFFEGDATKTALWFKTPNPMLGNISPRDMIRFGRYQKLLKFILNAVAKKSALEDDGSPPRFILARRFTPLLPKGSILEAVLTSRMSIPIRSLPSQLFAQSTAGT